MNLILIEGGTKKQREGARAAASFALSELLPRYRTLEIFITLKKLDAYGYCQWSDCNLKPRRFEIEIDKTVSIEELIKTVLHEMVHVKQYVKQELRERFYPAHKQYWKRKDCTNGQYEKLPWEVEAHRLEDVLYDKFIDINIL